MVLLFGAENWCGSLLFPSKTQLDKPASGAVAAKGTSGSKGKRSSGVLRTRDHEMTVLSRREMWHIPDPAPRRGIPWEKELRRNSSGKKNQPTCVALLIDESLKKGMRVIVGNPPECSFFTQLGFANVGVKCGFKHTGKAGSEPRNVIILWSSSTQWISTNERIE